MCYFRNLNSGTGELLHLCYAVITRFLTNDSSAIFMFQKSLISYLKEIVQNVKKTIKKEEYVFQRAASLYRSRKNFICVHMQNLK
jgi:hypothetical protein